MATKSKNLFDDPFIQNRMITATEAFRNPRMVIEAAAKNPDESVYVIKNNKPELVVMSYDSFTELRAMACAGASLTTEISTNGEEESS